MIWANTNRPIFTTPPVKGLVQPLKGILQRSRFNSKCVYYAVFYSVFCPITIP